MSAGITQLTLLTPIPVWGEMLSDECDRHTDTQIEPVTVTLEVSHFNFRKMWLRIFNMKSSSVKQENDETKSILSHVIQ